MPRFPPNVGGPDWPAQMMEPVNWRWFLAIIDWDWRNPAPLDELLAAESVPAPLEPVIQAIKLSKRPQKRMNAVNAANVRGADRMRVAAWISNRLGLIDVNKFNAERIAEARGEIDQRRRRAINQADRAEVFSVARDAIALGNVNTEALEDWVRELRAYARKWPNI